MTSAAAGGRDRHRVVDHHLTGARRQVLATLQDGGPATAEEIAARWPGLSDPSGTLARRLPAIVGQLAWKLERLGWIVPDEDRYAITAAGRRILAATSLRTS